MRKAFFERYYAFFNALLSVAARLLFNPIQSPKRLLVVRHGALGDGICALPALNAIRTFYSSSELILLSTSDLSGNAHLEQFVPKGWFHSVVNCTGKSPVEIARIAQTINADAVIWMPQYSGSFRFEIASMLLFSCVAKIKSGCGWMFFSDRFLHRQQRTLKWMNELDRQKYWLSSMKIPPVSDAILLQIDQLSTHTFRELLPQKPFVVFHLGGKGAHKQWPIEKWIYLAKLYKASDLEIVVVGGTDASERSCRLCEAVGAINLSGKLSVPETARVLRNARKLITVDSGPYHLAYAVGTPVDVIFSNADYPGKWNAPKGSAVRYFRPSGYGCTHCNSKDSSLCSCIQSVELDASI